MLPATAPDKEKESRRMREEKPWRLILALVLVTAGGEKNALVSSTDVTAEDKEKERRRKRRKALVSSTDPNACPEETEPC